MTAGEVLERVAEGYPNGVDGCTALRELGRVEDMVRTEVHGLPPLEGDPDTQETLIAQSPYDGLYEHYVTAMLAQISGESERYNNEMALFNALYLGYARARRRGELPARGAEVRYV